MQSKSLVNWLAILTLTLIIMSALTFSFTAAATTGLESKTEFLCSLIQNANTTVSQTYQRLKTQAITIPQQSLTAYNQALLLAHHRNFSLSDAISK